MAARDEPLVTAFETRDSRNLHLQRSFIQRSILTASTMVRSRADRLGLRDLGHQLLGDGIAEGIEVLRDRDDRAGAADEIHARRRGWKSELWLPSARQPGRFAARALWRQRTSLRTAARGAHLIMTAVLTL